MEKILKKMNFRKLVDSFTRRLNYIWQLLSKFRIFLSEYFKKLEKDEEKCQEFASEKHDRNG